MPSLTSRRTGPGRRVPALVAAGRMFARWKFQIALIAIIAVFAVLTGAFRDEPVAYAQEEDDRDYVDVGLILEVPEDFLATTFHFMDVIVVNNGNRTAYDVEVVVDVNKPAESRFRFVDARGGTQATVGQITLDGTAIRWAIPELGALQREELTPQVAFEIDGIFDNSLDPHEIFGMVTTESFESNVHKENNTARVWSYQHLDGDYLQVGVNYTVEVSVDNRSPSSGETVHFTVTAGRKQTHGKIGNPPLQPDVPPPIDLKVDIELTESLTAGTPSYHTTNLGGDVTREVTSQIRAMFPTTLPLRYNPHPPGQPRGGVFNIGTGQAETQISAHSVTLPVTVTTGADVSKQCLTATLTGNPPPGTGPLDDDIADNVAKVCLRGPEPLASGQVDVFTIYPCVGITDAPCDSSDDIRVRAVSTAYSDAPIPAGTAVFWLDPKTARIYDGHTNSSSVLQSVNNGNTASWQTAVSAGRPYKDDQEEDGLASGVELYYSRTPFVGKTSGWAGLSFGISARDVNGNTPPPGKVFLRSTSSGNEFRMAKPESTEGIPRRWSDEG